MAGVGMAYQLPALRLAFDNNSPEVIGVLLATGLLCTVGALTFVPALVRRVERWWRG